ncbi:hypothetical protein A2U01_0041379 [Trifolium medium]|uniref:Uncharacterized protein n=1 Tax=Trifolium medium TaxID=97028 RepID=A0A392Q8K6_9FABA|nr:hypothetical protein [Trifolium medium]
MNNLKSGSKSTVSGLQRSETVGVVCLENRSKTEPTATVYVWKRLKTVAVTKFKNRFQMLPKKTVFLLALQFDKKALRKAKTTPQYATARKPFS